MHTSPLIRIDAFLDRVPELFVRAQGKEREEYERIIYNLEPPATGEHLERMARFRGQPAVPGLRDARVAARVAADFRVPKYPSAEMLLTLSDVPGLSLAQATQILHFHHPAYPIFSEAAVRALNELGLPVVFATKLDEDGVARYEGFIAALDRLKVRIPFQDVPETNVFLSRLVEGALVYSG